VKRNRRLARRNEIPITSSSPGRQKTRDCRSELERRKQLADDLVVSKVEQMESELRKLSQAELRQIREWLDDLIEDELEFTPEFERSVEQAEEEMADGKSVRVREPEHA
jgi:hypothetical protein